MFETLYFVLGILNSLFLIGIFLMVKFTYATTLRKFGATYLLLSLPAILLLGFGVQQNKPSQYLIFLIIYLAFIALEGFYDFILKVDFRKNWKLLVPFLALYWSMNYGFIVMSWKQSNDQGIAMLGLFLIQLASNLLSHTKKKTDQTRI